MKTSLSLIFLPTLKCNADCEYCFERKSEKVMSLDQFRFMVSQLLDYMEQKNVEAAKMYWQGGEILTMSPDWCLRAWELADNASRERGCTFVHELQTNLIGYSKKWNTVISEVFQNQVGSSLDFPNLYRRVTGQTPATFNRLWLQKYREARSHGIDVGVISLPNRRTLDLGAEVYYSYYAHEIGVQGFQVNTPFPGGEAGGDTRDLVLDEEEFARFAIELIDVWISEGYTRGVGIAPFSGLLEYFSTGSMAGLMCGMRADCSSSFFSIDPQGNVAQCDCWVTSYPEFRFGNIFQGPTLKQIMLSEVRQRMRERPERIIREEDCAACDYLAICHGGCAIRAYASSGNLFAKDPYCQAYKAIFRHIEELAVRLAQEAVHPPQRQPELGLLSTG